MTVEQSPLERFPNQKQQQQPPILNVEKDAALSPTAGVIDLTNDGAEKEDDLKKAIALSLKEHEKVLGGQVSMEDQDISRVIEASLAESKAVGTKRKRGEVWQDPLNPHDRKRNRDWPVGLKNVGNTCWFSAVIQSLFHLPIFRKLVLSYTPNNWNVTSDPKDKRNLVFMQELRKLFALLLCSKRKYVDPSHALEEFKEAFPDSSGTDSQQDVSEFTHKLLEWLEDAFKINSYQQNIGDNGESMMEGTDQNPMLNLFYGHYLSEGQNEGRTFSNKETFGQYPLQVSGFTNIHESLEAAMAQEIESYDVMTKSGQESWFTQLPPVLLFELSRFQFNQQLGRPEKIHNKLEFPEVMYMDRYMEQNKSTTRLIREKVRKLKDEKDKLQNKLEKYLNYGSGSKKVPLSDALQYTLDYAESRKIIEENCSEDVEMASPASSSTGGDSPSNSPNKANSMEVVVNPAEPSMMPNIPSSEQVNHHSEETVPSPQHISELELKVLQACLKRWRKETECSVKNLQENINNIDNTIKEIYNDSSLRKEPYRLHAVLVHEGQAASGHYWAYVYCPNRRIWLKFNDVAVSEATWSELQRDSMGGHHYASAYCLLYVNELRPELFDESKEIEIGPEFLYTLPEDLQKYVEEDNNAFQSETEHWDFEQTRKKDTSTMTGGDGDCTIIAEKRIVPYDSGHAARYENSPRKDSCTPRKDSCTPRFLKNSSRYENSSPQLENSMTYSEDGIGQFLNALAMEHAILLQKQTLSRVEQFKITPGQSELEAFSDLVYKEMNNLRRLGRMPGNDDRLHHIGVYILANCTTATDIYLNWAILEQFLIPELEETSNGQRVKEAAMQRLETFRHSLKEDHVLNYKKWHQEYHMFRKIVYLFVSGVEHYHTHRNFPNALKIFVHCCHLNSNLLKNPGKRRGLEQKLLEHYRRMSCLKLNDVIANQFEAFEPKNALEALSDAYECILPSMEFLASREAPEADSEAAEIIRNRWCSMLGSDLASPKQERLQDFLSKLLDPSNDLPKSRLSLPIQPRLINLEERYRAALAISNQSGDYIASQVAK